MSTQIRTFPLYNLPGTDDIPALTLTVLRHSTRSSSFLSLVYRLLPWLHCKHRASAISYTSYLQKVYKVNKSSQFYISHHPLHKNTCSASLCTSVRMIIKTFSFREFIPRVTDSKDSVCWNRTMKTRTLFKHFKLVAVLAQEPRVETVFT